MDLFEAIEGRQAIRAYDGTPVEREVIGRLIRAAGRAPSANNMQPWHFYVASGGARERVGQVLALSTVHLQEYMDVLPADDLGRVESFFASLGNAPVAIAVTVPMHRRTTSSASTGTSPTGCALENLMLAAYAEGLGCCNITFPFWVRDQLFDVFSIPADREIVSLVLVGHPAETPPRRGRRDDIATFLD